MERRWLFLARSYEFTERLGDFSNEAKRNTEKLPKAFERPCLLVFAAIGLDNGEERGGIVGVEIAPGLLNEP